MRYDFVETMALSTLVFRLYICFALLEMVRIARGMSGSRGAQFKHCALTLQAFWIPGAPDVRVCPLWSPSPSPPYWVFCITLLSGMWDQWKED